VSPAGSTNIKQALEFNSRLNLGMTIIPAQDQAEAFLMVGTGRAVAFVQDDIVLAGLIANANDPRAGSNIAPYEGGGSAASLHRVPRQLMPISDLRVKSLHSYSGGNI
jgi:ABC-type amino acid transport substrate-binding protein